VKFLREQLHIWVWKGNFKFWMDMDFEDTDVILYQVCGVNACHSSSDISLFAASCSISRIYAFRLPFPCSKIPVYAFQPLVLFYYKKVYNF
jgi:hypothetical protein